MIIETTPINEGYQPKRSISTPPPNKGSNVQPAKAETLEAVLEAGTDYVSISIDEFTTLVRMETLLMVIVNDNSTGYDKAVVEAVKKTVAQIMDAAAQEASDE